MGALSIKRGTKMQRKKNLPELIHCAAEKMYKDKKEDKRKYTFCINDSLEMIEMRNI